MTKQTYAQWLQTVDDELSDLTGEQIFSHEDLADNTWRDWYDGGRTPRAAAREALENEGFELAEDDNDQAGATPFDYDEPGEEVDVDLEDL